MPPRNLLTFDSTLLDVVELCPSVKHFVLSVPDGFTFEAGQFVSVIVPQPEGQTIRRPYSIASSPLRKGVIELCIKKVDEGHVSVYFHQLQKGAQVKVMGPLGEFRIKDPAAEIVFIATGTGIAPLRCMYQTLLAQGASQRITLLTGSRFDNEILYKAELEDLMRKYPNFSWHHCVSRPADPGYTGDVGRVQVLVEKYVPSEFAGHFYLCGLFPMIQETCSLLESRGVGKDRIFFERYS